MTSASAVKPLLWVREICSRLQGHEQYITNSRSDTGAFSAFSKIFVAPVIDGF